MTHETQKETDLPWTGERYIPGEGGEALGLEHVHRYNLASRICHGSRVLDLGCGEGYGSSTMLQSGAATVVAVDVSRAAVAHATQSHAPFVPVGAVTDAMELPIRDNAFDLVVCFEVIEHVAEPARLLDEARRVLDESGIFIVSTPNKLVYDAEQDEPNPFHVSEMELVEFHTLLKSYFTHVTMLAQRVVVTSVIWPVDLPLTASGSLSFTVAPTIPYVVAVCSNTAHEDVHWSVFTNWTTESIDREATARRHIASLEATVLGLRVANSASEEREVAARGHIASLEETVERLRIANSASAERADNATARADHEKRVREALGSEVKALRNSKTFRYTSGVRRIYSIFRGR